MISRNVFFTVALTFTASAFLAGCGKPAAESGKTGQESTKTGHDEHEHSHADEGPHHGHLIELGEEEFHAELVHDDDVGRVTIYLLDEAVKESVAADSEQLTLSVLVGGQPKEFVMKATDAKKRDQFESNDKELVAALDHGKDAKGRLHVSIGNKVFVGIIQHEKHGKHDHGHK